MNSERIKNAIEILNYALENKVSITKAAKQLNRHESYVRGVRNDLAKSHQNDPLYKRFIEIFKQTLSASITNFNEQKEECLKEVVGLVDDGLLSKDTVIEKEESFAREDDNTLELDFRGKKLIKTVDDLIAEAKIDLTIWKQDKAVVNDWFVTMKGPDGMPMQAQNFQVKVWLSRIRSKEEQKAWNDFLASIRATAPDLSYLEKPKHKQGKKYMLELSLPDLHIGKLAWKDESGESFDTDIACQRYNETVDKQLEHISHYKDEIEEILLPVGNDMINIDNKFNKTTAGTDQRVDSRWQQMFQKAKNLLIENINKLSAIAPVKVVMVSGNHDYQTVYYLGCVLEAYYTNSNLVTVDNSPKQRKYYEYGVNMIGFTHGNEEKHQDLGLIMATEMPEMWARTKYRQVHLGHFHSRKTMKYLDVQEFQGFTVRILPSLSGTDDWHYQKGYMSIKAAIAFLYSKDNGLIGEFTHNIL